MHQANAAHRLAIGVHADKIAGEQAVVAIQLNHRATGDHGLHDGKALNRAVIAFGAIKTHVVTTKLDHRTYRIGPRAAVDLDQDHGIIADRERVGART